MTAREYLSQYISAQAEIETLTEEILRIRSLAEKVTVAFDSTGGSSGTPNQSKIEVCVDKILETEDKIRTRTAELGEIRDRVYETIKSVQDSRLRVILMKRYIGNESFEKISTETGYTYNHIVRALHPEALAEVEKILQNENIPQNPIESHNDYVV
jgi:hypothetical protein